MTEEEIQALQDKVTELTDANERITKNRDDIIGEKRDIQSRISEKDDAIKLLAEEKLKLAGDMDGLKAHYEKESAETIAKLQDALDGERSSNRKIEYDKEFNANIDMFHADHKAAGKAMLSNALQISYNDQGEKQTSYMHDGAEVANNATDFQSWASESDAYKQYLNGVDSSGAGATNGSRSGASDAGNTIEQKLAQRLKAQGIN